MCRGVAIHSSRRTCAVSSHVMVFFDIGPPDITRGCIRGSIDNRLGKTRVRDERRSWPV